MGVVLPGAVYSGSMVQSGASLHDILGPRKKRKRKKEKGKGKKDADKKTTQGYGADHKEIQLLRLRSFTLGRHIPDEELLAGDAQERIAALIAVLEPFVSVPP